MGKKTARVRIPAYGAFAGNFGIHRTGSRPRHRMNNTSQPASYPITFITPVPQIALAALTQLTTELFQRGYRILINLHSAMGSAKVGARTRPRCPGGVPPRCRLPRGGTPQVPLASDAARLFQKTFPMQIPKLSQFFPSLSTRFLAKSARFQTVWRSSMPR